MFVWWDKNINLFFVYNFFIFVVCEFLSKFVKINYFVI